MSFCDICFIDHLTSAMHKVCILHNKERFLQLKLQDLENVQCNDRLHKKRREITVVSLTSWLGCRFFTNSSFKARSSS